MNDKALLNCLFYRLKEIKTAKNILHISELKINGKDSLSFYSEITSQKAPNKKVPIFLYDDLFNISNDLVHFTSFLYLLKPFINDMTKEGDTYFQNWYDGRYISYAGILQSSVYNFWDRIGDLLYCYFSTGLLDNQVYIGRVLNNFPKSFKISNNFQKLNDIYNNRVRSIIKQRNEDVHNQSSSTTIYFNVLLEHKQEQEQFKLQLPDLFKEQISLAYEGFLCSLFLINESCIDI
jgi:hypothetical protein